MVISRLGFFFSSPYDGTSMSKTVRRWIHVLEKYANRWWYAPVISVLAALDSFVVIVPTDGLLVSAAMLAPRRWFYTALLVSLGSSIGAWALAGVLEVHGLPWLLSMQPGIEQSRVWIYTDRLMDAWGTWAVFIVSLTPVMQQPAIALAAVAGKPLPEIFAAAFAGRLIKYAALAYISTHAPSVLGKLWGFRAELEEAGVVPPHDEKKSDKPPAVSTRPSVPPT